MPLYWDTLQHALEWGAVGGVVGGMILGVTKVIGGVMLPWLMVYGAVMGVVLCLASRTLKVEAEGRGVLVTGCDSGFGRALAVHLQQLGFTVFTGCLDVNSTGATSLRQLSSRRVHVLALDVTSDVQVQEARKYVDNNLPKKGLWGVVNNAGCSSYGELEWVSLPTYSRTLDINLLGTIRVCQAFLPLVRRNKGRIVNMASGLCRMVVPMRSAYIASKYAVAGLTDCLRLEMKSWGTHVSVIEPGNYCIGTGIYTTAIIEQQADRMWDTMGEEAKADYGRRHFDARVQQMKNYSSSGMQDISPVIDAFTCALMDRFPRVRYQPMDLYFKVRCLVATHLPYWVYDMIYVTILQR